MEGRIQHARIWFALATLMLLAATTCEQSTSGSVSGNVRDTNGAAVPEAAVTITNPATNVSQTPTTNEEGIFNFSQLSPATYKVEVDK